MLSENQYNIFNICHEQYRLGLGECAQQLEVLGVQIGIY